MDAPAPPGIAAAPGIATLIARTAVAAVGAVALESRPAFVFDIANARIAWANGAAAAALGETLEALLRQPLSPDNPAVSQIRRLGPRLRPENAIVAIIRLATRGRSIAFTCRCLKIALPGMTDAMLAVETAVPSRPQTLPARAQSFVAALAGVGAGSLALADAEGRLFALADGLQIGANALAAALAAEAGQPTIPRADGLSFATAPLETAEGRFTLIAALPKEAVMPLAAGPPLAPAQTPVEPAITPPPIATTCAGSPAAANAAATAPPSADPPVTLPAPLAPPVSATPPSAATKEPTRPLPAAPPPAEPAQTAEPVAASAPIAPSAPAETTPHGAATPATPPPPNPAGDAPALPPPSATPAEAAPPAPFAFVRNATPVRFTFVMDADGRFTAISPSFAALVGPASADVVGRLWQEVATERGLDSAGAVARALGRRDTWSGVTVYWPVDGTDLAVAVDLAALPAFGRDRSFDGFRGFGVCRTADSQTRPAGAPNATETAPAPEADRPASGGGERAAGEAAASRGEVINLPIADRTASNVVRLPGKAPNERSPNERSPNERSPGERGRRPEPLSGFEEEAFRRIAEALGAEPGESPPAPQTPPAKPAPPQAEPVATAKPSAPPRMAAPPMAAPSKAPAWQPIGPPASPGGVAPAPEPAPAAAAIDPGLIERLPLALLVVQDGKPQYANKACLDLLGYADLDALSASGGWPGLLASEAPDEGTPPPTLRRADGSPFPADVRLQTVTWGGRPSLLVSLRERPAEPPSSLTTLAASGRARGAAEARVAELEAILDTATDGVIVIDAKGRIGALNRSAEALFAVDSAAVAGQPFTTLLAEESHRAALDYLDGLAQNGVASVLNDGREIIGKMPSGGLIPLFMTVGRLGDTGKFCAVLRDITHWKKVEEELVAARRAAESANATKSDFLAKISHEIRTPLNAIIGFSEVMIEERFGAIGNERYRGYLRDIHLSGAHLMSLINDLLDLSKIEAGKVDLTFVAVAVNDIIQECVALMQPQANRERIIIRTSLASALPNVVADTRSLRQIVLNLLSNAVKFTKAGGQVIVSTSLQESGEIVIRIRDTGVGMSEKDIETAMKPFRQISTAGRTRYDGTGLGLPLTKALVEANRATFSIDSAVDQGTLVKITFPTNRVLAE